MRIANNQIGDLVAHSFTIKVYPLGCLKMPLNT